jgi:nickel-dependent lactate racemase
MKTYEFGYGDGQIRFEIDDADVIGELKGNATEPIADIRQALFDSLDNPIGGPALSAFAEKGDQLAIIVSDRSRSWMRQDLVVPHLIDYLHDVCGIRDEDMAIVIATGTHEGDDPDVLAELVTPEVMRRIEVVNHDCRSTDLTFIGTTSRGTRVSVHPLVASRKVIALGACTHHVMAGFGGGRKSILPGVASAEAIRQNHAHALHPDEPRSNPRIGNSVLEGNPIHEDMCEGAAFLRHVFAISLVMNTDMKLAHILSGDLTESWGRACVLADEMYSVPIPCAADVVITSCGGFPKDMSLYQGSKVIDNLEPALKIGGTLILVAECRDGGGPAEYFDWLRPLKNGTLDQELRAGFTIPGYIFYLNCEQAGRYRIMMLSDLNAQDAGEMGIEVYKDMDELLANADIKGKKTLIVPNGSVVIPRVTE